MGEALAGFWLTVAVPVVAVALLARSLWVLAALAVVSRHLRAAPSRPVPAAAGTGSAPPTVVILLPMLREQSVAASAIASFAALRYPGGRAVVCVITTEREEQAKTAMRTRVAALATGRLTAHRLRGVFPANRADEVAARLADLPEDQRREELLRRFDEEPTTGQVVRDLLAKRSTTGAVGAEPWLEVVHLHQPVLEGRKASQLNWAVTNLDTVLGRPGDDWQPDNTYLLVYDADAVPDRQTLPAIAALVEGYRRRGVTPPGLIQQHRLPTLLRRPFPTGPPGYLLAAEWVLLIRRCLAIEWARLLLHERTARWRGRLGRALARPVVYAVGCGMAVRVPELQAIHGFPEPMEDIVGGFRLSLLGASVAPLGRCVADEPYTDLRSVVNLHSLVYSAYRRPARQLRAVSAASRLRGWERWTLVYKIRLDIAAWLVAAPLCTAVFATVPWLGPGWWAVLGAGAVLWGPVPAVLILRLRGALGDAVDDGGRPGRAEAARRPPAAWWSRTMMVGLVLGSPLFQWIEMVGGWRMALGYAVRRPATLGKTER